MSDLEIKCAKDGCGSKRFKGQWRLDRRQEREYDSFGNWYKELEEFDGDDAPEEMCYTPLICMACGTETLSLDDYHRMH